MSQRPTVEAALAAHGGLVWSLCARLSDEPEDAWQETWERVTRALPGWDPAGPARLSTWIATIAHRVLIDQHRRRRSRGDEVEPDGLIARGSVEAGLDLERALARLPGPWRRVVVLHHLAGLSLDEIAETEGVAVGTIKSRLHRARGALVTLLGGS